MIILINRRDWRVATTPFPVHRSVVLAATSHRRRALVLSRSFCVVANHHKSEQFKRRGKWCLGLHQNFCQINLFQFLLLLLLQLFRVLAAAPIS
nr:hypothetical protein CFP56_06714 [Quercus suber]